MRGAIAAGLALLIGCGGSVTTPSGAGGAGASSSDGSGTSTETGTTGSETPDASTFSVPPGRAYSYVSCDAPAMKLFVEIWPSADEDCVASPQVDANAVLVVGISGWDGTPGTFAIGKDTAHGVAHAAIGPTQEHGSITVEPFADTPSVLSWHLSSAEGRTDLALCGRFDKFPCASTP